jgi:hypothetical protein
MSQSEWSFNCKIWVVFETVTILAVYVGLAIHEVSLLMSRKKMFRVCCTSPGVRPNGMTIGAAK